MSLVDEYGVPVRGLHRDRVPFPLTVMLDLLEGGLSGDIARARRAAAALTTCSTDHLALIALQLVDNVGRVFVEKIAMMDALHGRLN